MTGMTLWPTLITGLAGVAGIAGTILAARAKGSTLPGDERSPAGMRHMATLRSSHASDGSINRTNQGAEDTCLLYSVSYRNAACEHLVESLGKG
jgi:hypothetical protein